MSRNATASWSGYSHQGKVGILVSLIEINIIIAHQNKADIKNALNEWVIEYESAEDFDIKHKNTVHSRHQVKAKKDAKYPNDYKDVLEVLKYKLVNGKCKIHKHGFQIYRFDKNKIPLEIEVDKNSRFLHTITTVNGFYLNKTDFENQFWDATYTENPNNIQLYTYPNQEKHCPLSTDDDQLKLFCIQEIERVLCKINHHFKTSKAEQENIYNAINGMLDNEIREKHNTGKTTYPTLTFNKIYNVITQSDKYQEDNINFVREQFYKSWLETQNEFDYRKSDCFSEVQIDEVGNIAETIYLLEDDKFMQLLKNMNPDKNKVNNLESKEDLIALCKTETLKDVFYECIALVTKQTFEVDYLGYNVDGGYLLTLISRLPAKIGKVVEAMATNENVTKNLFDRRYLVNACINEKLIHDYVKNTNNNWGDKAKQTDIFFNPELEFIDLETAIEKLNGGN